MQYGLNRLDEPVFMAVPKPMQTEFGIHHRLECCVYFRFIHGEGGLEVSLDTEVFSQRRNLDWLWPLTG